jgi:hypothetical protein
MDAIRIGRCIYCGTTQGPLDREHMIPAGLNGSWVLHEATCRPCSSITSAFEGHVLGEVFGLARAVLKMRTRRRHPTSRPLSVDRGDGEFETAEVAIREYPALVSFPEFVPPAYLDGRPYKGGIDLNGERTILFGPTPQDVGSRLGVKRMQWRTRLRSHTFPRLIAKIAYTFVVADVGLDGIETAYVLPAILGQTDDLGRWLGCDGMEYITDPRLLHGVSHVIVNGEILVRVRLFANSRAPEYVVVVGRLRPDVMSGKFKVSGPEGFSRARTLAEAKGTAQHAPEPFTQPNSSLTIKVTPAE